jgi:hypothetical protein
MNKPIYILIEQRPRAHTTDSIIHYASEDRVNLEELYLSLVQEIEYETYNYYRNNSYTHASAAPMAKFSASKYGERFSIIKTYKIEDIL